MQLGSVGYEAEPNERGERLIWLEPNVLNRVRGNARAAGILLWVILKLAAHAGEG